MANYNCFRKCIPLLCLVSLVVCQPEQSSTTLNPSSTTGPPRRTTTNGVFTYTTENPGYGTMADKLQNLLIAAYPSLRYNTEVDFRPGMNLPSDGDPEPTEVEIYFRSLRISQSGSGMGNSGPTWQGPTAPPPVNGALGLSWPSIRIEADFVVEYTNPQRTYDPNVLPSLTYLRLPRYLQTWDPELRFSNVSQTSTASNFINLNNYYNYNNYQLEVLANSDGRLLRKIPISVVLGNPFYPSNLPNAGTVTDNVFKLQIMSNTYTTDEMKLLWKKKNPVLFADNKFLNIEGMEWFQAHVLTSACKARNEEFGSFGVRKFSCLELSIKVTKAGTDVAPAGRARGLSGPNSGPVWTANFGTEN